MLIIIVRLICLIIEFTLMFGLIAFSFVKMLTELSKLLGQADFTAQVVCDHCNNQYEVTAKEFSKKWMTKTFSVTKPSLKGPVMVNKPNYYYYGKKFHCPYCNKDYYANVLNREEIAQISAPLFGKVCLRWVIIGLSGCFVIMLVSTSVSAIFEKIIEKQNQEELNIKIEQEYPEYFEYKNRKPLWEQ